MKLLAVIVFLLSTSVMATSMCIDCHMRDTRMYGPYAHSPYSFYQSPYAMPWWYPYGQYQYSNWQAPGLWQQYPPSMIGHHYPGGGNMAAAKPNVYVSGPAGTKFSIKSRFEKSTLWIAAPSLKGKDSQWRGEILADGDLAVDGVHYPYLYYDYRSHLELFQQESGFCGGKNQVIKEMLEVLEKMGFKANEIDDFREHWPHKLPNASKYCVFPQESNELQKAVEFEITPKAHLVQINFIVYLDHDQAPAPKPLKPWAPTSSSKSDSATFEVREWGVSFVVDEKKIP